MLRYIDTLLNKVTMFRLMVYYLGGLLAAAVLFSVLDVLQYDPLWLVASSAFLVAVCWLVNAIFAKAWNVPTNAESSLITALILALIIAPTRPDQSFLFLVVASVCAIASKYIVAIYGKHIFNPAAFGVALPAFFLDQSATWWVGGNVPMLPLVIVGGLFVMRKTQRTDLVSAYLVAAVASSLLFTSFDPSDLYHRLETTLLHTPLFFFAFVMITEPLTSPPKRAGRIVYGAIVGLLSAPWVHVGSVFFTPEIALLVGNIFSYAISPKFKAILRLKEVREIAVNTREFVFAGKLPAFEAGQYSEWTIRADASDSRGNRRYFTLASSPTESEIRLGVRFYENPSSYKKLLSAFTSGQTILAGSIAGDFTLPKDRSKRLAFIAGGIGVTPFRSMVKYMHDTKEARDTVLLYSSKFADEIAYRDVFDAAENAGLGFRAVYTITDEHRPEHWSGEHGRIDPDMIRRVMPDFSERTFYVSGPQGLVDSFKDTLRELRVPRWQIKTDYFPGF